MRRRSRSAFQWSPSPCLCAASHLTVLDAGLPYIEIVLSYRHHPPLRLVKDGRIGNNLPGTPCVLLSLPHGCCLTLDIAVPVMNMCAAGQHDPTKKYGVCGIITAIVCFPCGLICPLYVSTISPTRALTLMTSPLTVIVPASSTDVEKRCVRCGVEC